MFMFFRHSIFMIFACFMIGMCGNIRNLLLVYIMMKMMPDRIGTATGLANQGSAGGSIFYCALGQ